MVRSDSEYAIKTVKGTYKRKANLDLFPEIERLKDDRVSFAYVPGHSTDSGNNCVHDLVQTEIKRLRSGGKPKLTTKPSSPLPDGRRVIRRLRSGDEARVQEARKLFDDPPKPEATKHFLDSSDHHLLVAYLNDEPVGFVSGVEMTHPDKGTEMFLYELGVDEGHRRQGIGKALVRKLADLARERDCYGMWVLTERDNAAALATYRSAEGNTDPNVVLVDWLFDD